MIFWDSSGLVPLILDEEESGYCLETLTGDQEIVIWCLSKVEVISALCRREREGSLDENDFQRAKSRFHTLLNHAYEVVNLEKVKNRAIRLLEVHPLKAADACQLASALVVTQEDPARVAMITFDQRLMIAAKKEGFLVNP